VTENINKKKDFLINVLFFSVIGVLFFLSYKYLLIYIMPFLVGIFLAVLVQKPAAKISKNNKKCIAGVLVVLLFIALIGVLFLLCLLLYKNSQNIVDLLKSTAAYFIDITERVIDKFSLSIDASTFVNQFFDNFGKTATGMIGGIAKTLPKVVFTLVITVVSTCYFAIDYDKLVKFAVGFFSPKTTRRIGATKRIVTKNLYKIIKGYVILTAITFGELLVGFFILGIKNPIVVAAIVAVIDLLPVLGTGVVLLPWAIVLFFNASYFTGIGLVMIYLIIVFLRNFLEAKIVGHQIGIPPILNLLIIFFGLKFFGFIGMIFLEITIVVCVNLYKEKIIEL